MLGYLICAPLFFPNNAIFLFIFFSSTCFFRRHGSYVGRARDSWSGGRGFDPRSGHQLPTGWVGVSIM